MFIYIYILILKKYLNKNIKNKIFLDIRVFVFYLSIFIFQTVKQITKGSYDNVITDNKHVQQAEIRL